MKIIFFLFVISFNFLCSQELTKDEYLIYAEHLASQQLSCNELFIGIPDQYKPYMNVKYDTIDDEIIKISSLKSFNVSKMDSIVTRLYNEKLSTFIYKDKSQGIFKEYYSPIYFKNKKEAYLFSVSTIQLKGDDFVVASKGFYKAYKNDNGKWNIEIYIALY